MAAALASAARWNFHAVLHTDILLLFQSSQRGSEGDKMCKKNSTTWWKLINFLRDFSLQFSRLLLSLCVERRDSADGTEEDLCRHLDWGHSSSSVAHAHAVVVVVVEAADVVVVIVVVIEDSTLNASRPRRLVALGAHPRRR